MPVLSLHNTYSLPSGSASYTLGLSGAPVGSSYTYPTSITTGAIGNVFGTGIPGASQLGGTGGISSLIGTGGTTGLNLTSTNPLTGLPSLGYNAACTSYSTYTNPLLASGSMNVKLKSLDEMDLGRYGNRAGTPCSPIPSTSWGLDSFTGLDGVNPTFMHTQRPLSRIGGLDLDCK